MAIGALGGDFHTVQHDLESFFWVLVYLLGLPTNREGPHGERAAVVLDLMFATSLYSAALRKRGILLYPEPLPINPIYEAVTPFINELRLAVEDNYDLSRGKRGAILTYDAFLKILDDALVALEDDNVNVQRDSPFNWRSRRRPAFGRESHIFTIPNEAADGTPLLARSSTDIGARLDLTPQSNPQSRGSTKRPAPAETLEAPAESSRKKSRRNPPPLSGPPGGPRRSTRLNPKGGKS
jgi:hypothetical protein